MFDGTAYLPETDICLSCNGAGGWFIGDCENGDWETCPECMGYGEIEL